jgi:predicted MPP superfamily phosphohydrolase
VSDVHVGRWSSDDFLHNVIQQTNALDADLIVFTGDLIDISVSDLPRGIEVMRQLKARQGLYMIEGNHDLIDDPTEFHRRIGQSGLRFLWDAATTVYAGTGEGLQLLGLPWARGDGRVGQMVGEINRLRDPRAFPILLAHHPHAFDAAAAHGFPLVLAGHTHGGQFALGPLNAGSLFFRYISGLYRRGESQLLVSSGTGNWFPLRVNAPAEIIEVTLRAT